MLGGAVAILAVAARSDGGLGFEMVDSMPRRSSRAADPLAVDTPAIDDTATDAHAADAHPAESR